MALFVAAAAATFAHTMKELMTDKLRYYIFDKPGDKNHIKYMLSDADTGDGITRVPTEKWTICSNRVFFLISQRFLRMGERQNTQMTKPKQIPENREHAHRSQRQPTLQAHELDNIELNGGMDEKLDEGKYNDLADGRYEKTIYVKTWTGKTITVEIDLKHTVETVKGQIEAKTRIPKDHQHLASRGKVLMDNKTLKDYSITGGETIEMTALLLGGTKNKILSPTPMNVERRSRRREV